MSTLNPASLVIGGKRSRKHRKGNKSLTSWVTFVKKVAREERLPYGKAMKRASVRKNKGEKWMTGGDPDAAAGAAAGETVPVETEFNETGETEFNGETGETEFNGETGEPVEGGRRRRGSKRRGSKKRRGTKKRRGSRRRHH